MKDIEKIENNFAAFLRDNYGGLFQEEAARLKETLVSNKEQYDQALKEAATLKKKVKEIEVERKKFLKPFQDMTKSINALCKKVPEEALEAIAVVEKRATDWQAEESARLEKIRKEAEEKRKRELEELRKMQERELERLRAKEAEEREERAMFGLDAPDESREADTAKLEEETEEFEKGIEIEHAMALKEVKQETPKNVRTTWHFEIVDESLVPAMFKKIDEKEIGIAVRGGARKIPGIHIYPQQKVIAR